MQSALKVSSSFDGNDLPPRFGKRNNPVDANNYDFRLARSNLKDFNNLVESIIHMLMFGLGAGLLVLHAAYMECGIWTAMVVNIVLSGIIGYCGCMLVWSAHKLYGRVLMPQLTYPDIVEAAVLLSPWPCFQNCARCLRYIVEVILALHLYGACCVCVIMIARNLKELVEGNQMFCDAGDPPLRVYILSLMLPCVVICMVTNLKDLAPFALVAVLYAAALILVTLWYGLKESSVTLSERPAFKSPMGLFQFIGVCTYIMESVSYALPVENNMDSPKQFPYVILGTTLILTGAMIIIGFFGYWRYGEISIAPITVHFPFLHFLVSLKILICLILYVLYATCFYQAFDLEWFYLKRRHRVSNYWFREKLYRTLHVIAVTLISFALPNVTRLMGILGAFCTSPAVFIYPPFVELLLDWEYPGLGPLNWKLLRFLVLAILGLVIFIGAGYYNVTGMILEITEQSRNTCK